MIRRRLSVKRYYILRAVGYLYRVFAVLSVLLALGGAGFLLINFVGLPDTERLAAGRYNILWQQIIGALITGLLFGLLFGTLAQLIEVTLATNENTRQIAEAMTRQTKILYAAHPQVIQNLNRTDVQRETPV